MWLLDSLLINAFIGYCINDSYMFAVDIMHLSLWIPREFWQRKFICQNPTLQWTFIIRILLPIILLWICISTILNVRIMSESIALVRVRFMVRNSCQNHMDCLGASYKRRYIWENDSCRILPLVGPFRAQHVSFVKSNMPSKYHFH